jgi:hypothetical protein
MDALKKALTEGSEENEDRICCSVGIQAFLTFVSFCKKDQAGAVPRWDLWLLGAEIVLTEDNEENKGCIPESQGNFYRTQRRKRR